MTSTRRLIERVRVGDDLDLAEHDPGETFGWTKETAKAELDVERERLAELQKMLHAEAARAVLVVLQAMDAGGKDGVLREVFTGLNPAGVEGQRLRRALGRGARSRLPLAHPSPHASEGPDRRVQPQPLRGRARRARQAAGPAGGVAQAVCPHPPFREMLSDEGTAIVKLFLHTSSEEQRKRLQDRIDSHDERWKFRLGDLEDRKLWPDYMRAYRDALARTSTAAAPWYVVPGDRKWVRNLTVARILRHTLERLDPHYPEPEEGIEGLIVE